jgi:hypothetical protein
VLPKSRRRSRLSKRVTLFPERSDIPSLYITDNREQVNYGLLQILRAAKKVAQDGYSLDLQKVSEAAIISWLRLNFNYLLSSVKAEIQRSGLSSETIAKTKKVIADSQSMSLEQLHDQLLHSYLIR